MKIVLDTNVLIAALIARGVCHELLEHCVLRHSLITSEFILTETREKLTEKFGHATDLAGEAIEALRTRMTLVGLSELKVKSVAIRMTTTFLAQPQLAIVIASSPAMKIYLS